MNPGEPTRTIVLVKSCQKFHDRQEACRATWAGELARRGIPIWFAEGGYDEARFHDCWVLTAGGDDYGDNSFKVRDALGMLLRYDPFDFVFVCDDNTFVHPDRWMNFVPKSDLIGLHDPPKIPWVHGGAGWYMSRRACELFVAGITLRCSWDDRLVSEILSNHGIEIENRPEFFAQWDERVSRDNKLITCHNVSPEEMPNLFAEISES